jgi:polar amino acid transport system permease protein
MTCAEAIQAYAFRAIGFGERLLPRTDIGVCEQVVLIGSGMIWNIYFAVLALGLGFFFAVALAVAKASPNLALRKPAEWFIFVFRGSPLFIQFFMAYEAFVLLPRIGVEFELFGVAIEAETRWFARAWLGALIVLWLNTSAYSAEIFYGALRSVPKGDLEAADAYGLTGWKKFRRITFPTTMRLAWPATPTRRSSFPFHRAGVLLVVSGLPAAGRCAVLRELLRGPDLQPLHPLPHRGDLLRALHASDHRALRRGQQTPQPTPPAGGAPAPALPTAGHPMSWLDEHPEITSIRTVAADLNGQPRGKRVARRYADKALAEGTRFPFSVLNLDIWGEDIDDSPLVFRAGDPDGVLLPTERGFLPVPWLESPTALLPIWMFHEDGRPYDGDPRQALARVVERYAAHGLTPVVATEMEFYLIDDRGRELRVPPSRVRASGATRPRSSHCASWTRGTPFSRGSTAPARRWTFPPTPRSRRPAPASSRSTSCTSPTL